MKTNTATFMNHEALEQITVSRSMVQLKGKKICAMSVCNMCNACCYVRVF